jgi:hypothetical protein
LEVQDQGKSDFFSSLRKAAQQVGMLTAQTLGTGAVMAGSYLAKKILESVPEPTSVHDTPPSDKAPDAPAAKPHSGSQRAA